VDLFGFCIGGQQGPFTQTWAIVYQDGNSTPIASSPTYPTDSGCKQSFLGVPIGTEDYVYCNNSQQQVQYPADLGVARADKSYKVWLEATGTSADLLKQNSAWADGTLERHFNIDNQWGQTLPHQVTASDDSHFNFTSHIKNDFPYDHGDWKGALWWNFVNFKTPELPFSTYVQTFNNVSANRDNSPGSVLDDAYWRLAYKSAAKTGNCFGMVLDSIDAQIGRLSSYDEPIHQWFSGPLSTDGCHALEPSKDAVYADLGREINVKHGYQLGVDMINYSIGHIIKDAIYPSKALASVQSALANNGSPLLSVTSNQLFADAHVIRPYQMGPSGVPCTWISGSTTCTQVYVLDPNIPSGCSTAVQYVEFSTDDQWAYKPAVAGTPVYPAGHDYGGGSVSGGRIMFIPYSTIDHQQDTPTTELAVALAVAAVLIFGDTASINQVTDDSGRTLFKTPTAGASPTWDNLVTGTTAIPNTAPIPVGNAAAESAKIVATKGLTTTQHYDVGLASGEADGTDYEALVLSALMSSDLVAPGTLGVPDQVTLTKLGTSDKSLAFKVPANSAKKSIKWTLTGPDKLRAMVLNQLPVNPGQEITAFLENGATRLKIKNNGPTTSTTISLGSSTSGPISAGTMAIPTGESGMDCSWNGATPTCVVMKPEMGSIFGFENGADWTSQGVPLTIVADRKTEGFFALQVGSSGYRMLNSVPFSTSMLQGITSRVALDLYLPSWPSNKYWIGAVQLYVSCPTANIYNAYMGQVELTGLPLGAFTTATFNLTSQVVTAMKGKHSDFSIGIALNAAPSAPSYVLDNLRFVK